MTEHHNGFGANYTQKKLPVALVFAEQSESISQAFEREKQIQGWSRAKKRALIERSHHQLPELSRNRQSPRD